MASTEDYKIVERGGKKIGIIGLGEIDWITTLNCLCIDDMEYEDFNECAERMGKMLSKKSFFLRNFL